MPRPCKRRRVCARPLCARFGPMDGKGNACIVMALDEFETIRLIDMEGMTQEQCAEQMNVARTTAQAIYGSARAKLAECIVRGKELHIEGGRYELCDGSAERGCGRACHGGCYQQLDFKEENTMRIAVTYENGTIFQHFGHTEQFKLYDVNDGKVTMQTVVDSNGSGHGALADLLKHYQVDTLICGGIGGGAQQALASAGIRLYGGVSGNADQAVEALLSERLAFDPNVHCDHHDHEHGAQGHTCGSHGCGAHTCGQ